MLLQAGRTGGQYTAGLAMGAMVSVHMVLIHVDAGHNVFQILDAEKMPIPEEVAFFVDFCYVFLSV